MVGGSLDFPRPTILSGQNRLWILRECMDRIGTSFVTDLGRLDNYRVQSIILITFGKVTGFNLGFDVPLLPGDLTPRRSLVFFLRPDDFSVFPLLSEGRLTECTLAILFQSYSTCGSCTRHLTSPSRSNFTLYRQKGRTKDRRRDQILWVCPGRRDQ